MLESNENGNTLAFYQDEGNIYRFGFECSSSGTFNKIPTTQTTLKPAALVENNALRKQVTAQIQVQANNRFTETYDLRYSLVKGEPFLRMSVTGKAPTGTSVMVRFPLKQIIDGIEHGTPYHWDSKVPRTFGTNHDFNAVFEATHNFVTARSGSNPLGAIYHADVPPWAADGNALAGVILRNTPGNGCEGKGATGSDPDLHTRSYALRVPSGIQSPTTGAQLREAMSYNTPLRVYSVGSTSIGKYPAEYSLASVSAPAIITAAKAGTVNPSNLVLRIYQPTNRRATYTLSGNLPKLIGFVTALETPPVVKTDADTESLIEPAAADTTSLVNIVTSRALITLEFGIQ
jgi:hypothetical protein